MPFEDELKEIIQAGRSERERYEQAGRDFDTQWRKLRESLVWPVFHAAAAVFQKEHISAEPELTNGSIVLHAVWMPQQNKYCHELLFHSDGSKRLIVCSSSFPDSKAESFSLNKLDASVIEGKIKQFAESIARGDLPRTSD